MTLLEFTLMAFTTLFVVVDPIATVPAFLAMTADETPESRSQMARLACWVAAGVLAAFTLGGKLIFRFLGITLPAFQIAGSIVLLLIALDMLRAQRSRVKETREETEAGLAKTDIAITPLAIPVLAGPGAISSVILLHSQAQDMMQELALFGSIGAVMVVSYFIFHIAAKGTKFLNPIAMRIVTRLMGLLLAAVAIQFVINALKDLGMIPA